MTDRTDALRWGEILVKRHDDGRVEIAQADEHCLIAPSMLAAAQQQELMPWCTADGFERLTLDDGTRRVEYRIGGMVLDGMDRGYRLDRIDGPAS